MDKSNRRSSSSSSNSKLKHRFAQLLLGSSCTAAAAVGQSKLPPEAELADPHCRPCRKLDRQTPSFFGDRRVAPLVHVSIDCSARRSVETSKPLLPLMRSKEEEQNDDKKERAKKDCDCRYKMKPYGHRREVEAETKALLSSNAYGFTSSSSLDTENELAGLFSSNEEEEEEAEEDESAILFLSRRFSSDYSELFYRHSSSKQKKNKQHTRSKSMICSTGRRPSRSTTNWRTKHIRGHSCDGIDGQLRPLISISAKEKTKKKECSSSNCNAGFAVVKRSSDPYGDFRSSMAEMIVERGMSRAGDLERLLRSYLSLNSPRHHQVILEAFEDICEAIFGK